MSYGNAWEAEKLEKMKIHEQTPLDNGYFVTRVPGGWIYEAKYSHEEESPLSLVFVPLPEGMRGTV